MRRVVVTGAGMIAATGNDAQSCWQAAIEGRSGVKQIHLFDPEGLPVKIAAQCEGFDVCDAVDAKDANRTSRFVNLAAIAAKEAVGQSGLSYRDADTTTWGCSIGVGLGALDEIEKNTVILNSKGAKRISPFFLPYAIPNMAAGLVSKYYNLKGPNICTTTACASGTHAVGESLLYIRAGLADVMVAGGAESAVSPLGMAAFAALKALSADNDDPARASRPFDKSRNGFVMGEGAGVIVLEELEHAKARGASILAELVGYGMSGDAYHITAPAEDHEGGARCMRMALNSAAAAPSQIDYINAHGTSTKLNDWYESIAIETVFGAHAPELSVSSTKGVTGHCLGAAGGIEAVYTVLAVANSLVPPTANYQERDPDCRLDYTAGGAKHRKITYAMSNSFGFGGTNASIVFKAYEA